MFKKIKDFIQNLSFVGGEWRTDGTHKKTGTRYDVFGWNIKGWNRYGIHKVTQTAYDPYGWNIKGWNQDKINKKTEKKYDENGYDYFGFNKYGYDKNGSHYTESEQYYEEVGQRSLY